MLTTRATQFLLKLLLAFFNKHALQNPKNNRGNHKPYVYNTLKLAIIKRSHLKNKANKT